MNQVTLQAHRPGSPSRRACADLDALGGDAKAQMARASARMARTIAELSASLEQAADEAAVDLQLAERQALE